MIERSSELKGKRFSGHRRLESIFRSEGRLIAPIIFYSILISLFSLAVPIAVQSVVNTVALGGLTQQLVILSFVILMVLVFSGGLNLLQLFGVEILQRRLFARYALDFAYRIPKFEEFGESQRFGPELANPFLEVSTLQKSLSHLLLGGLTLLFQIFVGMGLLAFYHPLLLLFSICLILSVFFVFLVVGRGGVVAADDECSAKYSVLTWLEDMARMPKVFRSMQGERFGLERADLVISHWLKTRKKQFHILLRQNFAIVLIHAVASSLLLGLGGMLVIKGQLTLGQLVAAELVVNAALSGFNKFGKHLDSYYDLLAAIKKLRGLLEFRLEKEGIQVEFDKEKAAAELELEDLEIYSFLDQKKKLLRNVNLHLPPHSFSVVFGKSGTGKSILVDCIFGMIEEFYGAMKIDGISLNDISPQKLREQITLVGEASLFHGTLEENLTLKNSEFSHRELRALIERLALQGKVDAFPDGLLTFVGPQDSSFSTSELCLLSLIRALSQKPRLLIIDQTLDSIDDDKIIETIELLKEKSAESTILITTSKPKFLEWNYDQVFALENQTLVPLRSRLEEDR
jgi:ABC-type bacteriocin/lantibiotic exporter with double-glycine peptidase domain